MTTAESGILTPPSTGDRLLDGVGVVLSDVGWPEVTMAAVARAAGVSRQTLYKRFGSRGELAQAYVLREAAQLVARVETAVTSNVEDPHRALSAAFDVFLSAAADNPLVRAITTDPGAGRTARARHDPWRPGRRGGHRPPVGGHAGQLAASCCARRRSHVRGCCTPCNQHRGAAERARGLTGVSLAEVLGPFVDHALGRALT